MTNFVLNNLLIETNENTALLLTVEAFHMKFKFRLRASEAMNTS